MRIALAQYAHSTTLAQTTSTKLHDYTHLSTNYLNTRTPPNYAKGVNLIKVTSIQGTQLLIKLQHVEYYCTVYTI